MKLLALSSAAVFFSVWNAGAQTFAPTPAAASTTAQLEALAKKIDQQNAKIDILSQQILKLEQQIAHLRPGVMIGEATPATQATPAETPRPASGGNTHTISRGETLTSIAKMYKVSVDELQKLNRIENPLKLQVGQTILIPGAPSPAASPSP